MSDHDVTKLIAAYMLVIPHAGISSGELYVGLAASGLVSLGQHQLMLQGLSSPEYCRGEPVLQVRNHFVTLTPKGGKMKVELTAALCTPATASDS